MGYMSEQNAVDTTPQEFKLEELSKAAKVAKKTIHYYLNKGLLPPAKRIHARLSLYNENHLHLLKLIQRFKDEADLPLSIIKNIFVKRDFIATDIEENDFRLLLDESSSTQSVLNYIDQTSADSVYANAPSKEFIAGLQSMGLIESDFAETGKREQSLVNTLARFNELKIPLEKFHNLNESLEQIISVEKEMIINQISDDVEYANLVDELLEVNALVDQYISDKKAIMLRKQFADTFQEVPLSFKALNQKLYIPSPAFIEKNKVREQIQALSESIDYKDTTRKKKLVDAYLMIGDYENANTLARDLVKKEPENSDILIAVGTCSVFMDASDGLKYIEKAVELNPDSAKALCYSAMAYLIQASKFNGIFSPANWLKKSLDAFNSMIKVKPDTPRDALEVSLMKGRAYSILPSPLEKVREGIESLESLLEIISTNDDVELDLPIPAARDIIRLNACFYLGEAYESIGQEKKSQQAFEKVLLSDPNSNFGIQAYKKIN